MCHRYLELACRRIFQTQAIMPILAFASLCAAAFFSLLAVLDADNDGSVTMAEARGRFKQLLAFGKSGGGAKDA